MPSEKNKWRSFSDVSKQHKASSVFYADSKCISSKVSTCQPNVSKPSTTKLAKHIPSGFTFKIVGPDDSLTEDYVIYRGDNVAKTFVEHMVQLEERLIKIFRNPLPPIMSTDNEFFFQAAEKMLHMYARIGCRSCSRPLPRYKKVPRCHT